MIGLRQNLPHISSHWNPVSELANLQRAINRAFDSHVGRPSAEYPALNISANDHEAVVTAELPGVDPAGLEITVRGTTLTLKGERKETSVREGEKYHRRERPAGAFSRSIELPYKLDSENVQASLKHGLLRVVLPRAEGDKPRKVAISS